MSDPEQLDAQSDSATPAPPGRRKGKGRKRHTVAKVLLVSIVTLGMITGLSTVFLYRHLNGNLTELVVTDEQLGDRPPQVKVEGPNQPLNILVMGSDTRDGEGNNIDGLTGGGERSDTTILFHLSADRSRAYGVSIPRDSMVNRPECKTMDGDSIPGGNPVMWNEAFSVGGPACTIRQFEQITGVRLDHFIVVDFEGFRDMVDAIGGVQVCIPETIDDRSHGIYIEAGTRKIAGQEALNYVRERYVVGNGSDIGRMKRQQAFIAAMAHQVVSAGTLANPLKIVRFAEAATKSLQLDKDLTNLKSIGELGYEFRDIGLDKIQFITIPNIPDPADPNRLVWTPAARDVWQKIINDEPLSRQLSSDAIDAGNLPGSPSGSPSGGATQSPEEQQAAIDAADANGLCA